MNDSISKDHEGKSDNLECLIYEHYQELARNEDRLFNERLSNILTVQSILLAAFMVTLTADSQEAIKFIRTIIAVAGILICIVGIIITFVADKAWYIWTNKLEIMEKAFKEYQYNIRVEMPHEARERELKGWGKLPHVVGAYVLPLLFIAIWFILIVLKCI